MWVESELGCGQPVLLYAAGGGRVVTVVKRPWIDLFSIAIWWCEIHRLFTRLKACVHRDG